ncbi:hypothetical protein ACQP1O_18650 [Nocardia sp. CA-151230]|uniref:hypothetical protein n=1 Tax=Nocardia sp. CA-151230 TaxID=3239982 RepID=UPI003D908307
MSEPDSQNRDGVWHATRELRRWIALWLAAAGFLAWGAQTLIVLANALEPRDLNDNYLGSSAETTFELMSLALGAVTLVLGGGVFLLLFRLRIGRILVITGSILALMAQLLPATVASIPSGAFHEGLQPTVVGSWPLMIFPLLTIGLLLGAPREY